MDVGGTVVTVVIVVAVAAVALYAARHTARVARGKDSCCGGGGGSGAPARKKVRKVEVADTDPAHYPYTTELTVRGMSCEGCVENVQNALNALPGTWATVDLASRTATVRTKQPADRDALERAVEDAGYSIIRV